MKEYFKTIVRKACLVTVGLVGTVLLLTIVPDAKGSGAAQNLNITNYILSGQNLSGWPTNTAGTNGVALSTGSGVNLGNVQHFGFEFTALTVANSSTNTIGVLLCGADGANANGPSAFALTNVMLGATFTYSDWTTNVAGNGPIWIVMNIPNGTNWFHFYTNFTDATFAADLGAVGVFQITNYFNATSYATNAQAFIFRKLIPTPLIGQ